LIVLIVRIQERRKHLAAMDIGGSGRAGPARTPHRRRCHPDGPAAAWWLPPGAAGGGGSGAAGL